MLTERKMGISTGKEKAIEIGATKDRLEYWLWKNQSIHIENRKI